MSGSHFITGESAHFDEPLNYEAIKSQTQSAIESESESLKAVFGNEAQSLTIDDFLFRSSDGYFTSLATSTLRSPKHNLVTLAVNFAFVVSGSLLW